MNKTLKILLIIAFIGGLCTISGAFYIYKKYSKNLPDYEQLKNYSPMITTRLYSKNGALISEFSKEKRIFVPIDAIPKNLINAFLAAEDANFYSHSGIDPVAIVRTAIQNAISKITGGSRFGGASTITQQVVKNFLLSRERTIERKLKEAILALRMTRAFSKDHVLELYLNQIYLGSGSYGVAAASQEYFNKSVEKLTIEESALLATLPKAPSKLDPRKNVEKAKIRRDWVIDRMIDENFIEKDEGELAKSQPIILAAQERGEEYIPASFFSDSVKKELTELYGSDEIFENGIVVKTTLDTELQKAAIAAFEKGIEDYDIKHGYRGALGNIANKKDLAENWLEELNNFETSELYKENWQKAVILSAQKEIAFIGVEDGEKGIIELQNVKWAKKYIDIDTIGNEPNKMSDVFKIGDVILVEKISEVTNIEFKDEKEDEDEENSENIEEKTIIKYGLKQLPKVNGGFIALDPHSGRVLAMTGGYVDAPNQFNRATQAMRQPGSTLKTFGYLAALENGMTPATIIMDEEITLNQGLDLPPYQPANYSGRFYGPTTLRTGIEKSHNVTTVRMADQIGVDKVAEVIKRFGINDDPEKIYSLVLGSSETSVLRLARAYAMMANGGKLIKPSMIEKIQDRDGKTIYKRDQRQCNNCIIEIPNSEIAYEDDLNSDNQNKDNSSENDLNEDIFTKKDFSEITIPVLDEIKEEVTDSATAYQITSMLQGVIERGTGWKAKSVGKILGGKTGTTNNAFDSWFVGFSPDLVAAVYIGFDSPSSLGKYETGSSVALPIFVDFMKEALKETPSTPFRVPPTIKFVKINKETGKRASPETPSENTFFEAFKLDDEVEGSNYRDNDFNEDSNFSTDSEEPSGIY